MLSPIQVKIIPISDKNIVYAEKIKKILDDSNIRLEIDGRSETMQSKIRDAQNQKIPYMLVVGDREEKDEKVAVRIRTKGNVGVFYVKIID